MNDKELNEKVIRELTRLLVDNECKSCKHLHFKFRSSYDPEDTPDFWCGINVEPPHWGIEELPKERWCEGFERDISLKGRLERYKAYVNGEDIYLS